MLLSREFSVLASLSFAVAPRDQWTHAESLFGHPTRAKTRAHRQFWRKPLAHFRNRASSSSTPAHTSSLSSHNHHSLPSHHQLSKLHITLIHSFKSRGRFGLPSLPPSRWKPFHKTDSFSSFSFCKAYSPRSTSEQPITLTPNLHSYSSLVSPTPRRQCLKSRQRLTSSPPAQLVVNLPAATCLRLKESSFQRTPTREFINH